jgi:hypothetical protein
MLSVPQAPKRRSDALQSPAEKPRRGFRFRGLISLLTAVSFTLMTLSGVMLYLAPRGRVANWTNWTLAGLEKEQWSDLHMTAAVLLLVAIGFHLYFNWKPLVHYLKSRSTAHGLRLRELVVALALGLAVVVGTLGDLPPFRLVRTANETIKDAWESRAGTVGRAPSTRVQEGSVREFADRMGLPLERLQEVLENYGIEADYPDEAIAPLAKQHGVSLQNIYETASAQAREMGQAREERGGRGEARGRGDSRGGGESRSGSGRFGQMTLGEFCRSAEVPLPDALRKLKDRNIEATQTTRLRDLASQLDMTPRQTAEWLEQEM